MKELTKKALAKEFQHLCAEQSLNDIRVKDFIKYAHISKQTFYNYFKDKDDIMNYAYEIDFQRMASIVNPPFYDFHDSVLIHLQFFLEDKKYYMQLAKYETQNDFIQSYIQLCEEFYTGRLLQYHPEMLTKNMKEIIHIFCVGTCTYIKEWILNGMKASPEQVAKFVLASVPFDMKDAFDLT